MPITPFHFGPGALFKGGAPKQLSFTVFALANVLIDLEPVSLFFPTGDAAHPWLHTAIGAVAAWVGALAATLSHFLLDTVMHADVRPFWPLILGNPIVGLISIEASQWACVAAGVFGITVLAVVKRKS